MLTSANRPRWAGCRAGLWLQYAAVKIGPAPLAPHSAPAKRASWSGARALRAPPDTSLPAARGQSKGEPPWIGLAQPLRPTSRQPAPARASSPRLRARPRSDASAARTRGLRRGLSRARRQPRLADASRRFAVADARVDRCARLRRCPSMGFDGPIRPFGPDVRVEAHETKGRYESEPIPNRPLDNHIPIRARGRQTRSIGSSKERPSIDGLSTASTSGPRAPHRMASTAVMVKKANTVPPRSAAAALRSKP